MKNIAKKITSGICAVMMCATMVISASAADTTANDVIAAATANGVPAKYVTELKNYLDSNASTYKAADYDYMITNMQTASTTVLQPAVEKLYGAGTTVSSLSQDQLVTAFKSLTEAEKNTIIADAKATASHFGVELEIEKLDSGNFVVNVKKDGNVVIGSNTNNGALSTGAFSMGTVEVAAIVMLALASVGIVAMAKSNRKIEM